MRRASSSLVSAVDVRQNIFKWRTIDASWYLSAPLRGKDEFSTVGHLPGAVFLDIDAVSDRTTSLPHMLPSKLVFEDYCQSVGLENSDTIVIYDSQFFSSFRSWFMFKKVFGHESVLVLDGGLPAWRAIGGELEMGAAKPRKRSNYTAVAERKDKDTVVNFSDVTQQSVCVLDARPAARFRGEAPEPRPTLHAGHIPGAINIPWNSFHVDPTKPQLGFKRGAELRAVMAPALKAQSEGKKLVSSCGSGMSAALINFAMDELNERPIALYDGSWAEYGNIRDAPIEK